MQITQTPDVATGHARLQIGHLRVVDGHRRTGIGAALVRWAMHYAEVRECVMVQLMSNQQRTDDHCVYTRLGFVQTHYGYRFHP